MSDRTVGIGSTVSFGFIRARRGLVAAASIPAGVMASPAVAQTQQQIEWCENTSRAFSPDRQIDGCTAAIRSGDQRSQKELASYFNSRGLAYRTKGDFDRAVADFDEAIRLEPKNALLFNARGVAYSAKRDYGRAMADFDEAIRLEPTGAGAFLNNRGLARHSMNDYDGAIADFNEVIRLAPNYALAYYNRANAHRVKGDNDGAITDYRTRSGSIQISSRLTTIAELRTGPGAIATARLPITPRRSGSIRNMAWPITLAAMPTATRATAAVPMPTTPRPRSWASNLMHLSLARSRATATALCS